MQSKLSQLWEKVDGKIGILVGVVLTLVVLMAVIQFAAWAGPIVENTKFLRWILGWLF